jgi:hypothetical protein
MVDGRQLHFKLSGINNQYFIMRDTETGTWWQQVSGEAILGPLKGKRLEPISQDELTFAQWRREQPRGRVLRPDANIAAQNKYNGNWEAEVAKLPTVTPLIDKRLEPRAVIIGMTIGAHSKAYPWTAIEKQAPIIDTVGTTPVIVVLAQDRKSVRAFNRVVDGKTLELFAKTGTPLLVDAQTGSEWDFTGRAVSGPLAGKSLQKIEVLKDYWFDWQSYHPKTALYAIGAR